MVNQFETLGDLMEFEDTDRTGADSLYAVNEIDGIARRFSFILFDEIIESSPVQSRDTVFDPKKYNEDRELVESIQKHGITQPIVVREIGTGADSKDLLLGKKPGEREFALVAGHRRVAAGKAAGLKGTEGVLVRSSDDHEMITWAENMGRRELSSFEKAMALKSLQERRGLSERKTAEETGVSQTHINRLFSAFSSPGILRKMWKADTLSATAIIALKEHWDKFEKVKDPTLVEKLRGLSQSDAKGLRDQLAAGTDLATALVAKGDLDLVLQDKGGQVHIGKNIVGIDRSGPDIIVQGPGLAQPDRQKNKPVNATNSKTSSSTKSPGSNTSVGSNFNSSQKVALVSAIRDIFPKISEDQGKALFDYAIVSAVREADVVWAAALYIAKKGKPDDAIELASEAMSNPKIKSLINREVNQMKQASSVKKSLGKKDKNSITFVKKIFAGS